MSCELNFWRRQCLTQIPLYIKVSWGRLLLPGTFSCKCVLGDLDSDFLQHGKLDGLIQFCRQLCYSRSASWAHLGPALSLPVLLSTLLFRPHPWAHRTIYSEIYVRPDISIMRKGIQGKVSSTMNSVVQQSLALFLGFLGIPQVIFNRDVTVHLKLNVSFSLCLNTKYSMFHNVL